MLLALPAAGAFRDIDDRKSVISHMQRIERAYPRTGTVSETAVCAGFISPPLGQLPAVHDTFIFEFLS